MYAVERQRWIVERARADGRVEVSTVARSLDVAPETARRDLGVLERRGLVQRVHGGAVPVERLGSEAVLADRSRRNRDAKQEIAERALPLLADVAAVYLDEGSTVRALVDIWRPSTPVTVVTNALELAITLAGREQVTVIALGGRVRGVTSATVEHWAQRMLADLVVDVAVLGTNGLSLAHAFTCPNAPVAAVKSAAVAAARTRVVLADSTKFGVDSLCAFASWADVDAVVTDNAAPAELVADLRARGVDVLGPDPSAAPRVPRRAAAQRHSSIRITTTLDEEVP